MAVCIFMNERMRFSMNKGMWFYPLEWIRTCTTVSLPGHNQVCALSHIRRGRRPKSRRKKKTNEKRRRKINSNSSSNKYEYKLAKPRTRAITSPNQNTQALPLASCWASGSSGTAWPGWEGRSRRRSSHRPAHHQWRSSGCWRWSEGGPWSSGSRSRADLERGAGAEGGRERDGHHH